MQISTVKIVMLKCLICVNTSSCMHTCTFKLDWNDILTVLKLCYEKLFVDIQFSWCTVHMYMYSSCVPVQLIYNINYIKCSRTGTRNKMIVTSITTFVRYHIVLCTSTVHLFGVWLGGIVKLIGQSCDFTQSAGSRYYMY